MTRESFQKLTQSGLVFLDGATGTNLMEAGLPKGVCSELWTLEHPDIILRLQRSYVEAGSQILYAPTFGANAISLKKFGLEMEVVRLNTQLVHLCKEAAGSRALVAGDITTTGQPMAPWGELEYDRLFQVYRQQILAQYQAGVDLIVAETLMGVGEAVVALEAARSVCDLPVVCTLSLQTDGKAFFDGDGIEAVETLQALGVDAVGVNCSYGPDQLVSLIANLHQVATIPIVAKPNAGLPVINERGIATYPMGPEVFAGHMQKLVDAGATIVGGCCGSNARHIAALRRTLVRPKKS